MALRKPDQPRDTAAGLAEMLPLWYRHEKPDNGRVAMKLRTEVVERNFSGLTADVRDLAELDRRILTASALCGNRCLTDTELEAFIEFAKTIAIRLTLLEGVASGKIDFVLGDDGQIEWLLVGSQPSPQEPM